MKKVLALVLALTMVLGFAATASASYFGNYIDYDLFTGTNKPVYTIDGITGTTEADVDGNKEYKIKAEFYSDELNNFLGNNDATYDVLYQEYQVLKAIQSYMGYASQNWWAGKGTDPNNIVSKTNALYRTVATIVDDPLTDSPLYDAFRTALAAEASDSANAGTTTPEGAYDEAYDAPSFRNARRDVENEWNRYYGNSYFGYDDGIAVTATSQDTTYATITSQPTISAKRVEEAGQMLTKFTVEFKVRFTNTTFRTADVDVKVNYSAGGATPRAIYTHEDTLSFTVFQAQYRTFTEQDALIAFGVTPNVEISADDYAYISADAFRLMLQNSSRSITVVSGMGDSKVRFDKDSTNLPQDVFVGNFTTSANSDSVSINGFSSTTSAKIKIAVGRSFYNANNGKVISVYDANGNKLDVEATLQGDYTVNFYAPLSNYTVAGADWAGQTVPSTDAGKNNPSMGGAF